jgi:hypothetical protein
MASGKLLRQLIKTGAEGNLEAFRQASKEVIREEREKRHHLLANDLEKILTGTTLHRITQPSAGKGQSESMSLNCGKLIPASRMTGCKHFRIQWYLYARP